MTLSLLPQSVTGRWWRIRNSGCDLHMPCWVQKSVQRDKEGNGESPKGLPLSCRRKVRGSPAEVETCW